MSTPQLSPALTPESAPVQPGKVDEHVLEARQVELLYRNVPTAVAFSAFGTLMSVLVLHDIGETQSALYWLAYAAAVMLIRGGLAWLYHLQEIKLAPRIWARAMLVGNVLGGIQWGLLGTWLFPTEPGYVQLFVIMVIPSYVAGAIVTFAPVRHAHLALAVPAAIPSVIYIFAIYSHQTLACAMGLFFFLTVSYFADRQHAHVKRQLELEIERETVARLLAQANAQLGQENDALLHRAEVTRRSQLDARRRVGLLSAHIESTLLPVLDFDLGFRVIEVNQAATHLFSNSESLLVGQNIDALFAPHPGSEMATVGDAAHLAVTAGKSTSLRVLLLLSEAHRRPAKIYLTPIRGPRGGIERLSMIVTDAPDELRDRREQRRAVSG